LIPLNQSLPVTVESMMRLSWEMIELATLLSVGAPDSSEEPVARWSSYVMSARSCSSGLRFVFASARVSPGFFLLPTQAGT
jgi:hypothetical protein